MAACTFFGHKNTLKEAVLPLMSVLIDLVTTKNVDTFYVGNHGSFDRMVASQLKELKKKYPHISYFVVLAYIPTKKDEYNDYCDTVFPSSLDAVPYRARIVARNDWMIKKSDFVVTYVRQSVGGAAESKEKAEKQGKTVINLT